MAATDGNQVAELQVARWRKYGKDRLYVTDGDGNRVGWVDLISGTRLLERPSHAAAFDTSITEFCADHALMLPTIACKTDASLEVPAPRPVVEEAQIDAPLAVAPNTTETEITETTRAAAVDVACVQAAWKDLAPNAPGQAARAQAEAELEAMRERSRVGTLIARAFDMKTDERNWRVGADGEETVGARLEKLRKHGWHVLHAVPVGDRGSDIDHVLIGPAGVWTVNTKNHRGKSVWVSQHQVRVDGHKQPYLRNSRFEAERATRLLTAACGFPVFAKAVLVFLTGTLIPDVTIKSAPDDVAILDRTDIPGAFRKAKRRLSDDHVAIIFEHARRSTTWC
jgi:hypothetical protein